MKSIIIFGTGYILGAISLAVIHDLDTSKNNTQPSFELSPKDVVLQGSFDGKVYQDIEYDTLTIKGDTRRLPLHSQYRIKFVQSNNQTVKFIP